LSPTWYRRTMSRTVMKQCDVDTRLRMLRKWDFQCVICGHGFRDITSVSIEHLVPKSMGGARCPKKKSGNRSMGNLAPSHYNCNRLRGRNSLINAVKSVEHRRRVMGDEQFTKWINTRIPGRHVPDELLGTSVCMPAPWLPLRWFGTLVMV
jgi:5-methylcytosine-specific restriction endonuclease McrA